MGHRVSRYFRVLYLVSLLSLFTACGGIENPISNSTGGGPCGAEVVSEYKEMSETCSYSLNVDQARECKKQAQFFLDKYPDIYCTVELGPVYSANSTELLVTARDIREEIEGLSLAGIR